MSKFLALVAAVLFPQLGGFAGETVGIPWTGPEGISETTAGIMARQAAQGGIPGAAKQHSATRKRGRFPNRTKLPQNPASPQAAVLPSSSTEAGGPASPSAFKARILPLAAQVQGLNFLAATLADTESSFPPDTMGVVGPSEFVIALNGRIRSFDKLTGTVGALDADLDVFFASVRGPDPTTDPRIRYDRLSGRWFVTCITEAAANTPILLAVSSSGTINESTVWTYYSFHMSTVPPAGDTGSSGDYDTLGVDVNALYVGISIFDSTGNFAGATAFVIRKSSVLNGGPIVVTAFRNLTGGDPNGTGPAVPHGVDNYDPAATQGYFIGTDNATFGTLILRRVSNPGGTPSISGNIAIPVPDTALPIPVPHEGNTNHRNGLLDPIDDRLMAAHLRNGNLWTSHSVGVDNTGSSTGAVTRNGSRWYELTNLTGTPSVVQHGTVFTANTANVTTDRHYWMSTIMVSGQGHAAMGFSTAGTNEFVNAATTGRLATDPIGTMQTPVLFTDSTTAYNPPGDNGLPGGVRRWGDYSMTSVDPSDDMTMWTVQEFCNATNSYGVQVVKLIAPPPATPASCNPPIVFAGTTNTDVVLTGTSISGSGFFDPGAGFANRLAAGVSETGVTVNSVTYTDPTHITLNVTVDAGAAFDTRTVTVTNPDSQTVTSATGILTVGSSVTNAYLSNLVPSAGTLSPAFASGTTSYAESVPNATTTMTVTPIVSDSNATVAVNGTTVISGDASPVIDLHAGANVITTVVTASDGTTTNSYVLTVTRAPSTNANLVSLVPDAGTLSPSFASGTTSYADSVSNATTSITVTPTVADSDAMVTVNGTTVASGSASGVINLNVGANLITTVVTASNGTTKKTYKLTVNRAASANTDLASLTASTGTLTPTFDTATLSYTESLPSATASMTVTPTVADGTAKVYVRVNALPFALVTSGAASKPLPLAVGVNVVSVLVIAQNHSTKTYRVIVTRQQAPVVVVSSPASGATLPPVSAPGAVPVLGLAKDDVGVAQVSLALNGVALPNATLVAGAKPMDWVHWNASVTPENGLNVLTAQAEDVQGNFSVPRTAYFRYVVNRPALAGYYTGLATPTGAASVVTPPARQVGLGRVSVLSTGAITGSLLLGGSPLPVPFAATFGNAGDARFWVNGAASSALEIKRTGLPSLFLALNLDVSGTSQQITGTLSEQTANGQVVVSNLTLNRLLYTAAKNPAPPLMNVPPSMLNPLTDKGAYTAIFQAVAPPNNGLAAAAYPQGDGWALVKVYSNGLATVAGRLADGQPVAYANYLSKANVLPLYLLPYLGTGTVSGPVSFDDSQLQTDASGPGLLWFKPANARDYAYRAGWQDAATSLNGITVNFLGSKFVSPLLTPLATRNTLLGNPRAATPTTANALLALSGGLLPGTLSNQLSVNVANVVKVLGAPPAGTPAPNLAVTLSANGVFTGNFHHQPGNKTAYCTGVVLQKTQTGAGYFLGSPSAVVPPGSWQSGTVTISTQ